MRIRILSWNIRGANDRDKRKVIKALIKSQKVDLAWVQETKIQEMSFRLVHNLRVGIFLEWRAINSRDVAGCIMVFWDNRLLQLVGLEVGKFSILCQFKNC